MSFIIGRAILFIAALLAMSPFAAMGSPRSSTGVANLKTIRVRTHVVPWLTSRTPRGAHMPYVGTVKSFPGSYTAIEAITYDSDNGKFYIVLTGPWTSGVFSVDQTGHAKQLATLSNLVAGLAYDTATKTVYIANSGTFAVDAMSPKTGAITILAGGTQGTADGQGPAAQFQSPESIALDPTGQYLYVTDRDRIRILTTSGAVTTLTVPGGMGTQFGSCSRNQSATLGITYDSKNGNLYVADACAGLVRQVSVATGGIATLAGSCVQDQFGQCMLESRDGTGASGLFAEPDSIQYDAASDLMYVADGLNYRIRAVNDVGNVTTLAGNGHIGNIDGVGVSAHFGYPYSLAIGPAGKIFVADSSNGLIRTVASVGPQPPPPAHGIAMYDTPTLGATPYGLTATADGSIWFSESNTLAIGRIFPTGRIKEYPLPFGKSAMFLTTDAAGKIWFTEGGGGFGSPSSIGRLNPANGNVNIYQVPTSVSGMGDIVLGADGNIWFSGTSQVIGYITNIGSVFLYTADSSSDIGAGFANDLWILGTDPNFHGYVDEYSTSGALLKQYRSNLYLDAGPIARGPNNNMWFGQINSIGEVMSQTLVLYELPPSPGFNGNWNASGLVEGADGAVWFAASAPGYIGRMTSDGGFTPFEIPAPRSAPQSVTVATDGSLWFADPGASKIGRVF